MKIQLEKRLKGLQTEYEAGKKMLMELEAKQINLKETLLRISGAIQVLEEELYNGEQSANPESYLKNNAKIVDSVNDLVTEVS